jgi:hypothetical protein
MKRTDDTISYFEAHEKYKKLVTLYLAVDDHNEHLYYKIKVLRDFLNIYDIKTISEDISTMEVHLELIKDNIKANNYE